MRITNFLSFFLLGFISIIIQVVLQREIINSFYGNEIYIGIVLASWMAWTSIGARLCHPRLCHSRESGNPVHLDARVPRWSPRSLSPHVVSGERGLPPNDLIGGGNDRCGDDRCGDDRLFIFIIFLIGILFFGEVILLRFIKNIVGFPGEVPNLLYGTLIAFASPAPICLLLGAWWTTGNDALFQTKESQNVNKSYLVETLGFVAGGMAFGFLLVRFNELLVADIIIFLCMALLLLLKCHSRKSGNPVNTGDSRFRGNDRCGNDRRTIPRLIMIALSAYLFYSPLLGRLNHDTSALRFKGQTLLESVNSNYGNIVVTKLNEQYNFYENGTLLGTTEHVQFTEELVHLSLLQHKDPKNVLLIGGGLFGAIEEIRKHPVDELYYVELDPELIRLGRKYIPPAANKGGATLHTIVQDAYYYLKNTHERFDIIIMNIPAPSTQLANRFYTEDFFAIAHAHLNKDGVFCNYLPSSPSTLNKNLEEIDTSIYRSLTKVFKQVIYLPEDSLVFLSSIDDVLTYDPQTIVSRLKVRGIKTNFLPPDYFTFRLTTDRIDQMREIFERSAHAPINRQFRPAAYFLQNLFWLDLFYPSLEAAYKAVAASKWTTAILFALFAAALFVSVTKKPVFMPLISMGTAGFSLMALELVVIFAYQAIVGYLYYRLAILIAALMLGMAMAVIFGMAALPKGRERRSLVAGHYLICWFAIVFLAALPFISRWSSVIHAEVILVIFAVAAGFFGAIIFPISNRLYFNFRRDSSAIYSADLLGSCLGALLPSLIFIPVFGIYYTLAFVAGANLLIALSLVCRFFLLDRASSSLYIP